MGSQGDTEFLINSDYNAIESGGGGGGSLHHGPNGDLDSVRSEPKSVDSVGPATPIATTVTSVTFADVTPNKQRLPPPSELTPPPSLPSTPQKKFTRSSEGEVQSLVSHGASRRPPKYTEERDIEVDQTPHAKADPSIQTG